MNNLSLIVAIGQNNELGKKNKLIWHLPNDLKFFKETTLNKTIIMGRKTFESLPGLLPKRTHIIITSDRNYFVEGAIIMHSLEEVLEYVSATTKECFIIGGGSIYEQFLPYCENLYITEINATDINADVYFPSFKKEDYLKTILASNKDGEINYSHSKYTKKKEKLKAFN